MGTELDFFVYLIALYPTAAASIAALLRRHLPIAVFRFDDTPRASMLGLTFLLFGRGRLFSGIVGDFLRLFSPFSSFIYRGQFFYSVHLAGG